MKWINRMIDKLLESEPANQRLTVNRLLDELNKPGVERFVLSEHEASQLRKILAERLGREMADTPLPDYYNNVKLIIDPEK